jgi:hypothetical protein
MGHWARKVSGRTCDFGTGRDAALKRYVDSKDDLEAGRRPRPAATTATLSDVVNAFLIVKRERVESGELSAVLWSQYFACCDRLVAHLGRTRAVADLRPDDFAGLRAKLAAGVGPVCLLNYITRTRIVFKFAFDFGLIDRPVLYGNAFDRPSKATLRRHKAARGERLITAAEAWRLIDCAASGYLPPVAGAVLQETIDVAAVLNALRGLCRRGR